MKINLGVKMEIVVGIIAFIVGAGGGTGITWAIMKKKEPEVRVVETNKVVEKMVEVDNSLTETDLLKVPCSETYIEKNGESLCREMFCRMNTRSGNQSNAASSKECESISNLINTKVIIEACKEYAEEDKKEQCERLFEKRK